jgi:hypothetical protein
MPAQSTNPYWIDELGRKHEGSPYGDSDTEVVFVKVQGQLLRLLVPKYTPPIEVTVTASSGDLFFLIGRHLDLDKECEDGRVIEGGDGLPMVARRHPELDSTYWLAVCHNLFPQALQCLVTAE